MADVSKIFKPRRGKVSTMLGTKASTVLAAGEMFFEVPDTGVGTGRGRIMVGDGSTTYVNLAGANNNTKGPNSQAAKYFFPFTEDETIIHSGTTDKTISASSSISSSTVATYLNNAKSGNTLKTIIHNLREAIYTNACDIALLNNDLNSLPTKLKTVISTRQFSNSATIPNYANGKKYLIRMPIGMKGTYETRYYQERIFIGNTNATALIYFLIGNGEWGYICVQVKESGSIQAVNGCCNGTWIEVGNLYYTIFEII